MSGRDHPPDGSGAFLRAPVALDERITADGSSPWPVQAGRYRPVAARACPWANRAVIVRRFLGREPALSMGMAGPLQWRAPHREGAPDLYPERLGGRPFGDGPARAASAGPAGSRVNRRVPLTGGEKESLHASLERHRDVVLWKVAGLTDEQLRRPMTPSGTTLLGLVKHLAAVEYSWFRETFGRSMEPMPYGEDEDADLRVDPGESTAGITAFYARARTAADEVIHELGLDEVGTSWSGETVSLRWVLIHLVEETARHAGHLDIRGN
jgi:uncharacterized damage-inducible protein DinB